MNKLSIFGLNILRRSDSALEKFTHEEYYARYERIKYVIEAIPEIISNINDVFCHEYLGQELRSGVMLLGEGTLNNIYSVYGGSITDGENDVSLALRVKRLKDDDSRVYKMGCESGFMNFQLFSELNSFSDAFVKKLNPPYFTGLVEWKGPGRYSEGVVGFITEDVTKRKTLKSSIKGDIFTDFLKVRDKDGDVTQYFINSVMPRGYGTKVLKYGENPIRIDYRKK